MRTPLKPPEMQTVFGHMAQDAFWRILSVVKSPLVDGKYMHWDRLIHLKSPEGFSLEEWWFGLKFHREPLYHQVSLSDTQGRPFVYAIVGSIQKTMHEVDLGVGGVLDLPREVTNSDTRDRYLVTSLIEEAITSSQIEGAVTTRRVAVEMLRSNRRPANRSEQMILNNYRAIQQIRNWRSEPLTPELVHEIHRLMTDSTLEDASAAGRLRRGGDDIVVGDDTGRVLHQPPSASDLPERLEAMCRFANEVDTADFIHPIIRAIILHFWLAYDHPYVDGNGKTARALFYWAMLHHGYWLFEFMTISSAIRSSRSQYYRAFLETETDSNDLTYFVLYHLMVVERATKRLREYIERKSMAVQKASTALRGLQTLNHRQKALIIHALKHPGQVYSIARHQFSHGVVYQTARTDLLRLVDIGYMRALKSGKALQFVAVPDLEERLRSSEPGD